MKKVFAVALALLISSGVFAFGEGSLSYNGKCVDVPAFDDIENALVSLLDAAGMKNIAVYDSSDLTPEILENRRGTTIVERCICLITDKANGDGVILNCSEELGNYIGYRSVYLPFNDGSVMVSYMVYEPDDEHIDGIMDRYDFVLEA